MRKGDPSAQDQRIRTGQTVFALPGKVVQVRAETATGIYCQDMEYIERIQ